MYRGHSRMPSESFPENTNGVKAVNLEIDANKSGYEPHVCHVKKISIFLEITFYNAKVILNTSLPCIIFIYLRTRIAKETINIFLILIKPDYEIKIKKTYIKRPIRSLPPDKFLS